MAPSIRPAVAGDADTIAALHIRSWRVTYAGLMPRALLDGLDEGERAASLRKLFSAPIERGGFVVVETDATVRGFARWGPARIPGVDPQRTGEIQGVYLDPDHVGRGLGRPLMDHAQTSLVRQGYGEALVRVLEGNERALGFYEHLEFVQEGGVALIAFRGFDLPHVTLRRRF